MSAGRRSEDRRAQDYDLRGEEVTTQSSLQVSDTVQRISPCRATVLMPLQ